MKLYICDTFLNISYYSYFMSSVGTTVLWAQWHRQGSEVREH